MAAHGATARFRYPSIVVDSTDHEILEELVRLWGGRIKAKKKYKAHHRQQWTWRIYGTDKILAFLSEIEPFMRCAFKRGRARMLVFDYKRMTPRNGWYTDEQAAEKVAFENAFMNGERRGSGVMHRRKPAA